MNCTQRWIYWYMFVMLQQCHRHLITQTYMGVALSLSHCTYQLFCKALIGIYMSLKPRVVFSLGSEFSYFVLLLVFRGSTVYKNNIQVFQPWRMKSFLMLAGYYK